MQWACNTILVKKVHSFCLYNDAVVLFLFDDKDTNWDGMDMSWEWVMVDYQKSIDLGTRRKQTNRETEEKMDRWVKSRNE